jgi:hypothetical protein
MTSPNSIADAISHEFLLGEEHQDHMLASMMLVQAAALHASLDARVASMISAPQPRAPQGGADAPSTAAADR